MVEVEQIVDLARLQRFPILQDSANVICAPKEKSRIQSRPDASLLASLVTMALGERIANPVQLAQYRTLKGLVSAARVPKVLLLMNREPRARFHVLSGCLVKEATMIVNHVLWD